MIGLPDDEAGELPAAYVVLKPQVEATAEEIESFVAGRVATYKQLRRVTFVEAIPKSASGKILRRVLRDEAGSARPRDAPPQRRPVEACTMSTAPDRRAHEVFAQRGMVRAQVGSNSLREHR